MSKPKNDWTVSTPSKPTNAPTDLAALAAPFYATHNLTRRQQAFAASMAANPAQTQAAGARAAGYAEAGVKATGCRLMKHARVLAEIDRIVQVRFLAREGLHRLQGRQDMDAAATTPRRTMTQEETQTIVNALDCSIIAMAEELNDNLYFSTAAPERLQQLRELVTLAEYRERLLSEVAT